MPGDVTDVAVVDLKTTPRSHAVCEFERMVSDPETFAAIYRVLAPGHADYYYRAEARAAELFCKLVEPEHLEELLLKGHMTFGDFRLTAGAELKHTHEETNCENFGVADIMPRFDKLLCYYGYLKSNPSFIAEIALRQREVIRERVRLKRTPRIERRWQELEDAPWLFVDADVMLIVPDAPAYMRSAVMCWAFVMGMQARLGRRSVYVWGNGNYTVPSDWWTRAIHLYVDRMRRTIGVNEEDAAVVAKALQGKRLEDLAEVLQSADVVRAFGRMNRSIEDNLESPGLEVWLKTSNSIMEPPRFRDVTAFYRENPEVTFSDRVEHVFVPNRPIPQLAGVGRNGLI